MPTLRPGDKVQVGNGYTTWAVTAIRGDNVSLVSSGDGGYSQTFGRARTTKQVPRDKLGTLTMTGGIDPFSTRAGSIDSDAIKVGAGFDANRERAFEFIEKNQNEAWFVRGQRGQSALSGREDLQAAFDARQAAAGRGAGSPGAAGTGDS